MSELNKKIGQVIRKQRKSLDYTQEKLAELSDLNVTFIGEIERGHCNPTVDTLQKIAVALHLPLTDLIGTAEQPPKQSEKHLSALLTEYAEKIKILYQEEN